MNNTIRAQRKRAKHPRSLKEKKKKKREEDHNSPPLPLSLVLRRIFCSRTLGAIRYSKGWWTSGFWWCDSIRGEVITVRGIRGARSLKIARNYGTRVISFFFFFRESFRRRKNSGVYSLILLKGLEDGFVQEYEQSVNNRIEWNGYYPNVTKLVESSIHFRSSVSQTALLLLLLPANNLSKQSTFDYCDHVLVATPSQSWKAWIESRENWRWPEEEKKKEGN